MAKKTDDVGYSTEKKPPLEKVAVPHNPQGLCPESFRDKILIHTLHDGNCIPKALCELDSIKALEKKGELQHDFIKERDWGANIVASRLAYTLGLPYYYRVNIARIVFDFNRFPGSSPPLARPLDRLAIIPPFAQILPHQIKRDLLEKIYDSISVQMEDALDKKKLFISIHTYDEHNMSQTQRPEVSILTRALSYQQNSLLPYNLFSPLFPDVLAECTADRILRDRLALTLQRSGIEVEHNYPYCLPDGSLEVRSLPWLYFREVRRCYNDAHPEHINDEDFIFVWKMLLNTNLRHADAETLSGYLHRFRRAPQGELQRYQRAEAAYAKVTAFLESKSDFVAAYRNSPSRTSALGIEVRKDLVWDFENGLPIAPKEEAARQIADKIALGFAEYLTQDH